MSTHGDYRRGVEAGSLAEDGDPFGESEPRLIYCDVCGELATVGAAGNETMMTCGDSEGPVYLCDAHGNVDEEGVEELEQADGVRSLNADRGPL